jgi:hypothetical protein
MVEHRLIILAPLSFAVASRGAGARAAPAVGQVTSALTMLVALLSLGVVLAPTVIAAAIALIAAPPGATHRRQRTSHNRVRSVSASRSAYGIVLWFSTAYGFARGLQLKIRPHSCH